MDRAGRAVLLRDIRPVVLDDPALAEASQPPAGKHAADESAIEHDARRAWRGHRWSLVWFWFGVRRTRPRMVPGLGASPRVKPARLIGAGQVGAHDEWQVSRTPLPIRRLHALLATPVKHAGRHMAKIIYTALQNVTIGL